MYTWDPAKNLLNKEKHGISFEEARDYVFEGRNLLVHSIAYEKGEIRHAIIGKFKDVFYTGIFTIRDNKVRIISVRRARNEEKKQAREKGL